MPYVVLDVDGPSVERSKKYADLICVRLARLGADPEQIVVSYTGGRGFHVRIPAGMVGNPIFRTASDARRIVGRFAELIFGELRGGDVLEAIDAAKFSPNSLIRAIGARHEESGLYCVAFGGKEFLMLDLWKIKVYADVYSGYTLSDPLDADTAPRLANALHLAGEEHRAAREAAQNEAAESRGIIAAIEEGVGKGEEFAAGHVGHNKAALLLSLNYVQRFGKRKAWERVKAWNQSLPQPLGTAPDDYEAELRYVFERSARYAEQKREPAA